MAWLSGYKYRKKVTIKGESGAGTDYQVKLEIGHSSGGDFTLNNHCTDFPNDIRFTDNDEETLLDYWIVDDTLDPIEVWIEVSDNLDTNKDIYVYYNKSGASSNSNGINTFLFFDDFEDGDVSDWTKEAGVTFVAATDYVKSGTYSGKYTTTVAWEAAYKAFSAQSKMVLNFSFLVNTIAAGRQGSLTCGDIGTDYDGTFIMNDANQLGYYDTSFHNLLSPISAATWYDIEIIAKSLTKYDIYIDGNLEASDVNLRGTISNYSYIKVLADGTLIPFVDDIRVRKYVSPEPLFSSAGNEEQKGGEGTSIIYEFQIKLNLNEDIQKNSTWLLGGNFIVEPKFINNIKKNNTYLVGYNFKVEPTIQDYFKHKYVLNSSFKVSSSIEALFSIANHLSSTLNFNLTLQSKCGYHYTGQMIHNCIIGGNTEYTHTISGSGEGNLLNYRVTQEWGTPYDIAELNYKKFPEYGIGDYVSIKQLDYFTGNEVDIFRGVAIDSDKKYKKDFEETTVRAVSNEWYLTKQKVFWTEDSMEQLSLLSTINAKRYIKYWLGGGSFSSGTEGNSWQHISGVKPHMFPQDVPHWDTFYYNFFNFWFGTTKLDAIMQICNTCDFTFWAKYKGSFAKRYAYFYPRSMIDSGYYPFGVQITIDATDDAWGFNKRLLEIKSRESQTTFDTKINRVAITTQVAPGEYVFARKQKPYTGEPGGPKGVEVYQPIDWKKDPPAGILDMQAKCDQLYDALRKSSVAYEAKLLSLVEKADHTTLHTGMKIKFQNVDGHPEDDFRITKIIHEKSGTDATAITTIQYRDTDLIHLGSPKLNEIETILDNTENKIEDGNKIYGYPSSKNPRATSVGTVPRIDLGEVVTYNESENIADIKILGTNQILKGVAVI